MERSGHRVALTKPTWPIRLVAVPLRCSLIVILAGVMVAATPVPTKPDLEDRVQYSQQEIRRAITFYAKRYRLDPALLRAVIKTESDFRQDAVSRKGAIGLMQLTPDTAATLRVADVYDSLQNIRGGAKQLRHLLNIYEGDLILALAAYNAGVHRIKGGKVPQIRETRSYVRKVLRNYEHYREPSRCGGSSPRASCESSTVPSSRKQANAAPRPIIDTFSK
jgi:soluble lytic murein transglycosylase-like protein